MEKDLKTTLTDCIGDVLGQFIGEINDVNTRRLASTLVTEKVKSLNLCTEVTTVITSENSNEIIGVLGVKLNGESTFRTLSFQLINPKV